MFLDDDQGVIAGVHQQEGSVRILSILSASQLHPVHTEK